MYKCTVMADTIGNTIGISENNPEYGYIRVEQVTNQISEGGWLKLVKRSALIKGTVEDLKAVNYKEGDEISGRILVKESLEPFNPVNPEKNLKIAGSTGIICKLDNNPIYRDTYFTIDPYKEDEFISHDNTEEIKDAQLIVKEATGGLASLLQKKTQEVDLEK